MTRRPTYAIKKDGWHRIIWIATGFADVPSSHGWAKIYVGPYASRKEADQDAWR